ncbi:hypothetical protein NSZ01_07910 [Nocardioides szechwanensis]|uniref:Uncharacterized protein n=1 Tax=Nocardioides szechwanensis TaxID=1005944 RepID=A0A1G9V671_9ACTN|nr:hypothetical protein [Nocardioides szechwanensis]GEP33023.1 hypothetical protein NSZ01_07910 [Nocardioides szechwanensis]SDM67692.1 hypothetical protein SAMN05192576_0667 [Nocardioides szechwanensis]
MTPYEELTSPQEMHADCEAVSRNLRFEARLARAAESAVLPAPSIHFEDFPREIPKREIRISDAATRLANALQLHLD